jgi:hypothetical protein
VSFRAHRKQSRRYVMSEGGRGDLGKAVVLRDTEKAVRVRSHVRKRRLEINCSGGIRVTLWRETDRVGLIPKD